MANTDHGLSKHDLLVHDCLNHHALNDTSDPLPQVFGYLHKANPVTGNLSKDEIVDAFDALVDSMKTSQLKDGKADAGMTFFGQFIDHDITLDARSAIGTVIDPRSIRNIRTPNLDLDCVYGDGPEASPHLYSDKEGTKHFLLYGRDGSPNDLPRNDHNRALIGDPRNDENIIVSQIQGAFICLHNILMSNVKDGDMKKTVSDCAAMGLRHDLVQNHIAPELHDFEEVRRFVRWHYQWLVLHDFLPSFVDQKVIDEVLEHDPFHDKGPIMPAEFSGAAYRFGHATVQPAYHLKKGDSGVELFSMQTPGFTPRGPNWDIEMRMYFDVAGTKAQKALPVGTKMADTLFSLPFIKDGLKWGDHEISVAQSQKLALRNILRDRTALLLPSGQQMARKLGIDELEPPKQLTDAHIDKTPLWFYCLQEAEEKGHGKLTGVGGRIVASVIIRLLKLDPESVLHVHGFKPWEGFGDKCTMGSVMEYVEKHRDDVKDRKKLYCGPSQDQVEGTKIAAE